MDTLNKATLDGSNPIDLRHAAMCHGALSRFYDTLQSGLFYLFVLAMTAVFLSFLERPSSRRARKRFRSNRDRPSPSRTSAPP